MRKFLITLLILMVAATSAYAQLRRGHSAAADGDSIVSLDGETVAIEGEVAADAASTMNPVVIGGVAETTVPTAVADADAVNLNMNEYGEQRVAGYNNATGNIDVTVTNSIPREGSTWNVGSATLDDDPTSLTSNTVNISTYKSAGFLITYDETDSGDDTQIAVTVDVSDDDSTWYESSFYVAGAAAATVNMGADSGTDDENFHIFLLDDGLGATYARCVLTCTGCAAGGDDQAAVSIEFAGQK